MNAILRKRIDVICPCVAKSCFTERRWVFEVSTLTGRLEMKIVWSAAVEVESTVSCWRRSGSMSSLSSASSSDSAVGIVDGCSLLMGSGFCFFEIWE